MGDRWVWEAPGNPDHGHTLQPWPPRPPLSRFVPRLLGQLRYSHCSAPQPRRHHRIPQLYLPATNQRGPEVHFAVGWLVGEGHSLWGSGREPSASSPNSNPGTARSGH